MHKLKILHISKFYAPYVGGIERIVRDIAESTLGKIDVNILACQTMGSGRFEEVNGVPVRRVGSLGVFFRMPVSITLPFILRREEKETDILHFHFPFPLAELCYLIFCRKNKKVVVTYHSDIVRQKTLLKLFRPFLEAFLKRADMILFTNAVTLENCRAVEKYRHKCKVLVPFMDKDRFDATETVPLERPGFTGKKIVLFVGRLVYYKGIEFLIEAMREVDAILLIVGSGPLLGQLRKKADRSGLSDKILFLGELPDGQLKYCYSICDVFVLPSVEVSEALGLVQMEAMFFGKPVINTSLKTGVTFVSINDQTGLTVPPRDAGSLSKAINKILNDKNLAGKLGENGKYRVLNNFSKERFVDEILSVYREVDELKI